MKQKATRWDRFTAQADSTGDCTIDVTGYVWWKLRYLAATFAPGSSNAAPQIELLLKGGDSVFQAGARLKCVGGNTNPVAWAIGLAECSTETITQGAATGLAEDGTALTTGIPDLEIATDGQIVISGGASTSGTFTAISYVIEGVRIGDDS